MGGKFGQEAGETELSLREPWGDPRGFQTSTLIEHTVKFSYQLCAVCPEKEVITIVQCCPALCFRTWTPSFATLLLGKQPSGLDLEAQGSEMLQALISTAHS